MGHEKIDTTEDYVNFAKHYYRNALYDWIRAVMKFYKSKCVCGTVKRYVQNHKNKIAKKVALASVVSHVGMNVPIRVEHYFFELSKLLISTKIY